MKTVDVVIAGAGIVGLATAYQLLHSHPDWKIIILEKEAAAALHQTGRNSGVVHTGIYYKPGSLKAKNCIEGRKELLTFCDTEGIAYQKKHKLIVATRDEEFPRLLEILTRGQMNRVPGIRLLSEEQVHELEPHVQALQAILIPECHIIDYKQVAQALCRWIQQHGGQIVFNEPLTELREEGHIRTNSYSCRYFINCTGLHSDRIARNATGTVPHQILPFRGEYYELAEEKKNLVQGLIYPVPDPKFPFLGVHLTPMMNGKVEAGPNAVLAFAREGYRKRDFDWADMKELLGYSGFWQMAARYWKPGVYEIIRSMSKRLFLKDLQRLVPSIQAKDLSPGGVGIRAQVVTREGKLLDDFAFMRQGNMLHVINAPSPAATASFAIGRTLAQMMTTTDKK